MTLREKFKNIELDEPYIFISEPGATECEKIADELAIGFAEWCDNEGYTQVNNLSLWKSLDDEKGKYSIELLKIYKKEKGL
jgi:hypothetical protein